MTSVPKPACPVIAARNQTAVWIGLLYSTLLCNKCDLTCLMDSKFVISLIKGQTTREQRCAKLPDVLCVYEAI